MSVELPRLPSAAVRAELVHFAERCIHCGLCLEDCPTYHELGSEMDSPRGRILLMRSWADDRTALTPALRTHLDRCLDCRACESACPSGVQYGALIEHTRAHLPPADHPGLAARLRDWFIFEVLPRPGRLRAALLLGRIAAWTGLADLGAALAPALAPLTRMMPRCEEGDQRGDRLPPEDAAPRSSQRGRVQLFRGCATAVLTPRTVANAQRVLLHNGCAVACPRGQDCCGAIHHHGGRIAEAQTLARRNIDVFEESGPAAADAIVSIAAGCGAMLRQYDRLLADDAQYAARACAFVARVRDVSEYLWELGPLPPRHGIGAAAGREVASASCPAPLRVTYHDPCHLVHAQRVSHAPRALLRLIPGVELVECGESSMCCGAAGTYNLLQPEIATGLGRRKLDHLTATGAVIAATGNIGCMMHLRSLTQRGQRASASTTDSAGPQQFAPPSTELRRPPVVPRIVHTIDLLHEAYGLGGDASR